MARTILVLLVALALAGCTSDDDTVDDGTQTDPGGPGDAGGNGTTDDPPEEIVRETVQVTVTWSGAYLVNGEYSPGTVTVPANSTVELTFENDEINPAMGHDLVVEGFEGASTSVIDPGQSETVTFDVDGPTQVSFYCSVPGHRGNGMEGDFIVEA